MKKFVIGVVIFAVIFGLVVGVTVKVASKLALLDIFVALTPTESLFPKTNVLILGIDNAFGHRSDTIMILHADPSNKKMFLVSIPRDVLAVLPGRGLDKVNHAYAYGGIDLTKKTIEYLFKTKTPYYIVVNLSGIKDLIDEIGGVDINVEKRMYYVDYAGDLYIDIKPGQQTLSGKDAVAYLRYRSDGGDLKRISRQQKFVHAFASKLKQRENIFRTPAVFMSLLSHIETNLKAREILGLCLSLRAAFDSAQAETIILPGYDMMVDGIYYIKPDKRKLDELIAKFKQGNVNDYAKKN